MTTLSQQSTPISSTSQWSRQIDTEIYSRGIFINLVIAAGALLLIWYAQYKWKRRRLYELAAKLPGPKLLPILGNALMFAGDTSNILDSLREFSENYGSPSRAWLGPILYIVIDKPKDLEVILTKCLAKDYSYRYAQPYLGEGLFSTLSVAKWKRHRKVIMPTFNQKILESFIPVFNEQSVILNEKMEKEVGKEQFDIFRYVSPCTLDIICETAMGVKLNNQENECDYVKCANRCMEIMFIRMFQLWYHFDFIFNFTSYAREERKCIDYLHNFTDTIVKKRRAAYNQKLEELKNKDLDPATEFQAETGLKRKAFLDLLLESSNFTDEEIREEVDTMTLAGNDTSAATNCYVFMVLGIYSDVQDRVYQEILEVFGDSDRPVETHDLGQLKYLEMVIKETMRMLPIGTVIVRAVTEETKLDSCTLPKGCSCVLCIERVHYDPEIWPEPEKFIPERFTPEEIAKRHPYSYIPFSAGPRNCLGPKYAMIAMKVLLVTVLRKYQITTNYKLSEVQFKLDLMMKPKNGFQVGLELRQKPEDN